MQGSSRLAQELIRKSDIGDVLDGALAGKRRLGLDDCIRLVKSDDAYSMGLVASILRQRLFGDTITFVNNIILNYTNVCAASCPLCAFYRKGDESDAYTLSTDQIVARAKIAIEQLGATELHIVGGFHPKLGLDVYDREEAPVRQVARVTFPSSFLCHLQRPGSMRLWLWLPF